MATEAVLVAPGETELSEMDQHRIGFFSGDRGIKVMTRNVYVGADVDSVILALASEDPTDDLPALPYAIGMLQQTDFPARAAAIANEIAKTRPHAVGFQEISRINVDLTWLDPGIPVVALDFLPVFETELAARGLNYQVAASIKNIDATPLPGVQLVDYDAAG